MMPIALKLYLILMIVELVIWIKPFWRLRRPLSISVILLQPILLGLLLVTDNSWWFWLIFLAAIYRMINLLRLIEGRTEASYLYQVARLSSFFLIISQLIVAALYRLSSSHKFNDLNFWKYLGLLQIVGLLVLIVSTHRTRQKTNAPKVIKNFTHNELPSLTVAIPARNETEDLISCLDSLVNCTYPKLEILVLDDCSQDKHTSLIIKNYAQKGVVFIRGTEPQSNWLAKNWAYQQLFNASNGELILFCGVDSRFNTQSLSSLVEIMLTKHKSMISIMPINKLIGKNRLISMIMQTNRYAWENALPRRQLKRPPVLSTCWLINKASLRKFGEFSAVKNSVSIESYFARQAINSGDGYSYLASTESIGITCQKLLADQYDTTIRTRYPQLHRRPELVGLVSLLEAIIFILPLVLFVYGLTSSTTIITILAIINLILGSYFYTINQKLVYRHIVWYSPLMAVAATVIDIAALNISLWRYEFSQVVWKNRNICLPVMRMFN